MKWFIMSLMISGCAGAQPDYPAVAKHGLDLGECQAAAYAAADAGNDAAVQAYRDCKKKAGIQ